MNYAWTECSGTGTSTHESIKYNGQCCPLCEVMHWLGCMYQDEI
jgi:hypothetical protein